MAIVNDPFIKERMRRLAEVTNVIKSVGKTMGFNIGQGVRDLGRSVSETPRLLENFRQNEMARAREMSERPDLGVVEGLRTRYGASLAQGQAQRNLEEQLATSVTQKGYDPRFGLYDPAKAQELDPTEERFINQQRMMAVANVTGGDVEGVADEFGTAMAKQRATEVLEPRDTKIGAQAGQVVEPPKLLPATTQPPKGVGDITQLPKPERYAKFKAPGNLIDEEPLLNTNKPIPVTDIHGDKSVIPEGEPLRAFELKGGKYYLKDGDEFVVNKNQYQNIKSQSVKAEAQPFAPELEGTTETVRGDIKDRDMKLSDLQSERHNITRQRLRFNTDLNERIEIENKLKDIDSEIDKIRRTENTKFSQYTLPGGENYREVLIRAPSEVGGVKRYIVEPAPNQPGNQFWVTDTMNEADTGMLFESQDGALAQANKMNAENSTNFTSSHWDEPNVLAHVRLNDRTYNGKPVTFIEEIQSDWAREARKSQQIAESEMRAGAGAGAKSDIPNNPLLKNWQELAVKRALKEAVDGGSEYLAWTTGEQQAARYDLSKQLDEVYWQPERADYPFPTPGSKDVHLMVTNGDELVFQIDKEGKIIDRVHRVPEEWMGKNVADVIGKGLSEKIMKKKTGTLRGEGLRFGGEWANNLYDRQLPKIIEDLTGQKPEVLDMGLPISVSPRSEQLITGTGRTLTSENIKPGLLVGYPDSSGTGESIGDVYYIITKDLGNGRFRAAENLTVENTYEVYEKLKDANGEFYIDRVKPTKSNLNFLDKYAKNFDLGTDKSRTQMGIRLTPQVKAKVLGEAPPVANPKSLNLPFEALGIIPAIGAVEAVQRIRGEDPYQNRMVL
jgi:hypothetical protein